jgi:hypothetical protein
MYTGQDEIITSIQKLDLLFEVFRLADQVAHARTWICF